MGGADGVEQELLELANRFRLDPAGEFDRLVRDAATRAAHDPDVTAALRWFEVDMTRLEAELAALGPAPPLAWSGRLARAAEGHAFALIDADAQAHQLPGGPSVLERIEAEGYAPRAWAENVYAYSEGAVFAHAGLVVDWGGGTPDGMQAGRGHRVALISPIYRDLGVAAPAEDDPATGVGPRVVVQKFADDLSADPRLLGVVYRDRDGDGAYDAGEGRGGAVLRLVGEGRERTGPGGGWTHETVEGEHHIVLRGKGVAGRIKARIDLGPENEKLDLVDGRHLFTTADLDLIRGGRSVTALGVEAVELSGARGRQRLEGAAGDDVLAGEGGADRLLGRGGHDLLLGGGGRDRIAGGAGRDTLDGGGGRDRLLGGAGDDVLKAGAGNDVLKGGPGADRFVFAADEGRNRIKDWDDGAERLDLRPTGLAFEDVAVRSRGDAALLRFAETTVLIPGAAGLIDADDLMLG
ncbi:MAG: hypothetical protein R6V44_18585 [Paracoccaceae bacterium]